MPVVHPPKLLLIGWDAADWRVIRPLLQRGEMPNLQRLMATGAHGPIQTLAPILSPMLWTSIATGKRAWKHGIHGFSEPLPNLQGVRPISVLSRKAKAFWNILNQNGYRCNVVGWWPSHPAEPLDGAMISKHYAVADVAPGKPWPVKAGMVHPARLAPHLEKLRLHPTQLGQEHLLPFIPRAAEIDQENDSRLHGFAKILSEAVRDFEIYSGVIEGAYKFHDMKQIEARLLHAEGFSCEALKLLTELPVQNMAVKLLSGDFLLSLKDYPGAAAVFSKVLQETPENAEARLGLARSYPGRSAISKPPDTPFPP